MALPSRPAVDVEPALAGPQAEADPPEASAAGQSPPSLTRLLSGGKAAFERILQRIDRAHRSILVRCFEWRDDDAGRVIGQALLSAADRGVAVTILKDRVARCYEHVEASKQSFFHKRLDVSARLQAWFLMGVYGRWGSLRQRPSALAEALVQHPRVTLFDEKRFDHAKLYVFDDETVILGGMGIGDDFRDVNVDFMVEIAGGDAVSRLSDRYEGTARFDPDRPFDYLLHSFRGSARTGESLPDQRHALIASTRRRLTIEMAYLGDRDSTDALVDAVGRGVAVTLLTAERANVNADSNRAVCAELLRRTGNPENLRIVLHPRMVHGKAMVGDGEWVDLGSTNFTLLSHGAFEEVDLFSRDRALAAQVERAIESDAREGRPAEAAPSYRRRYAAVELTVSRYYRSRKKMQKTTPTMRR